MNGFTILLLTASVSCSTARAVFSKRLGLLSGGREEKNDKLQKAAARYRSENRRYRAAFIFRIRISVSELDGTVLAAGAVMRHPDIKQAFICHKLAAVIIIAELLLGNAYCNAFAFSRIKLSS